MAAKFVYLATVFRPGLADGKTFAFSSAGDRDAFAVATAALGKVNRWYRVETSSLELHTPITAMTALKAAWER
jgi:hypothetical protein